jgi:hypothetical protein
LVLYEASENVLFPVSLKLLTLLKERCSVSLGEPLDGTATNTTEEG